MNKQAIYRLWHTFRLYLITDSGKRAEYLKKHRVFYAIGNNCTIMDRKVPLYSNLISIGNNVHLASKVLLVTHDAIHLCFNGSIGEEVIKEKIGCIHIGDNVFIGSNSTILCDVKIGSNVVVAAGSVVVSDIPDGSVVAGVPSKVIGRFEKLLSKRTSEDSYPQQYSPIGNYITKDFEKYCWDEFFKRHNKEES